MPREDHNQIEPYKVKGKWWIPGTDHKVAGTLSYKVREINLTLYGGLTRAQVKPPFNTEPLIAKPPIIHGQSLDGVLYSILDSFYLTSAPAVNVMADFFTSSEIEIASSKLNCSRVVEGSHFSEADLFERGQFEFPGLVSWLDEKPFETDFAADPMTATIKYARPKEDEFDLPDVGCRVRISSTVALPGSRAGRAPSINHNSLIEVLPNSPQPLTWFIENGADLTIFLSCCFGTPVTSKTLRLYPKKTGGDPISVYYAHDAVKEKEYGRFDFLVPFKAIKPELANAMNRFIACHEATRRTQRILISSERSPADFIDSRFLTLMLAVESLTSDAKYVQIVDRLTFRKIRKAMMKVVPEDATERLRTALRDCLNWGNGDTLRGRIAALFNTLKPETCELFCVDRDKFIGGIVPTRNYYTHHSKQKKILQGLELHWAIEKLRLMIRVALLIQAGVNEDRLRGSISSNWRKARERGVWSKLSEEGSPPEGEL